ANDLCSGVVIQPTWILTAAHCLTSPPAAVLVGSSVQTATVLAPSGYAHDPAYDPNNVLNGHDIGLVAVSSGLPTPVASNVYRTTNIGPNSQGSSIRIVGFGDNASNGGAGTKRTGTTTLDVVYSDALQIGSTSVTDCFGDSGGPALLSVGGVQTVVGTASTAS